MAELSISLEKKAEGFDATLDIVNAWIQNMERAPGMCGGPEALEFQMLQLVEVRQKLLRPLALAANPYETRDAMIKWICSINGETTNTFLHCILREEGRLDELPKLLADYARWVAVEYPPEN